MHGEAFVVTGAGGGIGRRISERLSKRGLVIALDTNKEALRWTDMSSTSSHLVAIAGDAADDTILESVLERVSDASTLRGWVNNASVFRDIDLHTSSSTDMYQLVQTNLAPAIAGCRCAVRSFLKAGVPGAIVNISSHQAQRPVPGALAYATSKSAIEGLTRAVAVDYGPAGIRCNALALGSIETDRSSEHLSNMSEKDRDAVLSSLARIQPLMPFGSTDDVADAVEFLVSDSSRFLSGTVISLDGARAAHGDDPESRNVLE
ncbi:SDR family NAD(P)-dependent oxidoreductase [Yoonia sp. 2307UL14-13]|uniref:SDR family NAD(P)-dependent oxidoreductase n=1 Tax=Yoonia sp. 2307UL14-13 TaxID=3126506 RepID=UPI0030AA9B38